MVVYPKISLISNTNKNALAFTRIAFNPIARIRSETRGAESLWAGTETASMDAKSLSRVRNFRSTALQRYVSELLGYFAVKHGDARHLPNEAIGVVT